MAFDALQVLRLLSRPSKQDQHLFRARLFRLFASTYWIILSASAFACAICYGRTPKPDATAIQVLIFLHSIVALVKIFAGPMLLKETDPQTLSEVNVTRFPKLRRFSFTFGRNLNRLLKIVRFVLSILFVVGAAQLASQYRFKNP